MSGSKNIHRFEVRPDISNHFAWLRTRVSLDRTMMAWIRTAVSLIGFGFTITQFFQHLREAEGPNARPMLIETPRDLGLTLIAAGIVSLAVSAIQYRGSVCYLWSEPFKSIAGTSEKPHHTPAFLSAMVLIAIGIAAFGAVFLRLT